MFVLPKEEDSPTRLVGQMRNYLVKGVTSRGDFTYEGEDHILDAFNLAIFGFQQHYGQLLSTKIDYSINYTPDPRMALFPKRSGQIDSPKTILFKNTYRIPVRDPEKPISRKPIRRSFAPFNIRKNIDSGGGMFGR